MSPPPGNGDQMSLQQLLRTTADLQASSRALCGRSRQHAQQMVERTKALVAGSRESVRRSQRLISKTRAQLGLQDAA